VFVSLVSTKIPFKGAGKEYIGAAPVRAAACQALPHGFVIMVSTPMKHRRGWHHYTRPWPMALHSPAQRTTWRRSKLR